MEKIEQTTINQFTAMCNHLTDSHSAIGYGDIPLKIIEQSLRKYLIDLENPKIKYLDCIEDDLGDLPNLITAGSLIQTTLIILVDNIDHASKSDISSLLKTIKLMPDSEKYLILLAIDPTAISPPILSVCRKFKIGAVSSDLLSIKEIVQTIFTEQNREKVFHALKNMEYPLIYILSVLAYNLPNFFQGKASMINNTMVLDMLSQNCNKIDADLLFRYIQFGIQPALNKRVVQFPPRMDKKEE